MNLLVSDLAIFQFQLLDPTTPLRAADGREGMGDVYLCGLICPGHASGVVESKKWASDGFPGQSVAFRSAK